MISLLPNFRETLVLRWSARDILQRLTASTSNKPFLQPDEPEWVFTGWIMPERFRISLRSRRQNHYLPLVIGQIEESSSGTILLLRYTLFPTMRLLLQLWTLLIILGSLFLSYQYRELWIPLGGVLILAAIYLIAWSNFFIQLKQTREAFHRIVA